MPELTNEQRAAVECGGKVIVSASAGSGKTFVMIKKLVREIENGVDMDCVLAVTFTKKAAAQMKEKLRLAVIERMKEVDGERRARLKLQLSKIPSASISTIHAFCARLLRTYFYCADIDGAFDIIAADDAVAKELKGRALDNLFERLYAAGDESFITLLKCFRKKRSDAYLRSLVLGGYEKLRIIARYGELLDGVENTYTEQGFRAVCFDYTRAVNAQYDLLLNALSSFAANFISPKSAEYAKIFGEMAEAILKAQSEGIFAPKPKLCTTRKPVDGEDGKEAGERFKAFKDELTKRYNAIAEGVEDEQTERGYFFSGGREAVAFARVLKQFDAEYTAVKREENKLDYNDLEHLTLKLLGDKQIQREISSRFTCVFVDEYQDVNPVQEEIIAGLGAEKLFLVGDVKQAIYGFRGSKSLFFAEKYDAFEGGDGTALRLSDNFRSSDGVLSFVNRAFSDIMTERSCGIDYKKSGIMYGGGGYPEGSGTAEIHVFGGDDVEEERASDGIYSVLSDSRGVTHTREGLAVLEIVGRELKGKHYDLKTGEYVDTQTGDICILTRKRSSASVAGIVRALTDAGYGVSGAQENNICNRPEVREMLDVLSYIDNPEQDIAMTTAMLSPLGGFTCDELAKIRIASSASRGVKSDFVGCCKKYAERMRDGIAEKLLTFFARTEELRNLADVFCAADLIDFVAQKTGMEAVLAAGGGEKLRSIRRLAEEAGEKRLAAFLAELKEGGYDVSAPSAASSDSIKIMTMHASKGLEFPVVILADVCATFKGRDYEELPLNAKYGFAPKYHDCANMLVRTTLLRRLTTAESEREELKNELNLFYVACTRAMCNLHVLAREVKPYSPLAAANARSYSQLFDLSAYSPEIMDGLSDFTARELAKPMLGSPDEELKARVEEQFMRPYFAEESVNLPVKSSASALLRLNAEEEYYRPRVLFSESDTGAERGTAYHRFLELCDFDKKSAELVAEQLDNFVKEGCISPEQRDLLDVNNLTEIVNMPVFGTLGGATLYREREFLCRLPANELFATGADDYVLLQGAIDLLAVRGEEVTVIDYKYSHKSDAQLAADYAPQLRLYKKAAALALGADEERIRTVIININLRRQIVL